MTLDRYIEDDCYEDEKDADKPISDSNKVKAEKFMINDLALVSDTEAKSLRGLQAGMDRIIKETESLLEKSIEIKDLTTSNTNFVGMLEMLTQKLDLSEGGKKLRELTIDGLSKDLFFKDMDLIDRFGRGALFL